MDDDMLCDAIEVGEWTISTYYQQAPENPRKMGDCFLARLTQLCDHYGQPDDSYDPAIIEAWRRTDRDIDVIERYASAFLDAIAVAWWDDPRSSSRIFGYITRAQQRENTYTDADSVTHVLDAQAALDAELAEYAAWVNGEVYGYVITDVKDEVLESCWGYYGDAGLTAGVEDAKSMVAYYQRERTNTRTAMFRRLIDAKAS